MHSISLVPFFDIQLFAEGGDGGTGAGNAGTETTGSAAPVQPQPGVKNPLASVKYGKPPEAPAAEEQKQQSEPIDADRNAAFEALIKGEYKDLYGQKVRDAVSSRLKANEETVKRYDQLTRVLGEKYNIDPSNPQALFAAIEKDNAVLEAEAQETGRTVDELKADRKMRWENAQLRAKIEEIETREQSEQILADWREQSEAVKKIYPAFDLQTELQDPQFRSLLQSRVPIQTAFEVLHKDEIIPAAMQYTAKQVEQKVVNSIRAGQSRPAEGAMGTQSAAQYKSDVSQLTKADIDEINRRVARGERIVF